MTRTGLLWPVMHEYDRKISWANLMASEGNRALETMGFTTFAASCSTMTRPTR